MEGHPDGLQQHVPWIFYATDGCKKEFGRLAARLRGCLVDWTGGMQRGSVAAWQCGTGAVWQPALLVGQLVVRLAAARLGLIAVGRNTCRWRRYEHAICILPPAYCCMCFNNCDNIKARAARCAYALCSALFNAFLSAKVA